MTGEAPLSLDALRQRLAAFRGDLASDPLANPVRRLSHELSRAIESGALTLDATEGMIAELAEEAAADRAARGRTYLEAGGTLDAAVRMILAGARDVEAFRRATDRPLETIVFTGHPTFAMGENGGAALRGLAPMAEATKVRAGITLDDEHREA